MDAMVWTPPHLNGSMCSTGSTFETDEPLLEKVDRTFSVQGDLNGTGKQETIATHILDA
jgi:hypothetical protein